MTITIELTPEDERRLRERAARLGQDMAGYLRQLIEDDLGAAPRAESRTFAEILAPVHEDFRRSGMTEGELDALLDETLRESRAERRAGKNPVR